MIAPEAHNGKGLWRWFAPAPPDHEFVSEIILLPDFGQGSAKLPRMMASVVTSGPVF
jgi:hypothetical protein